MASSLIRGKYVVAKVTSRTEVEVIPDGAVFQRDGYPVVYRLAGSKFEERRVEVARRGREQAIIKTGVVPGDRIAARRPGPELIRRTQ